MYDIILHNEWALGDTVCLSALVRDIHRAYPGVYDLWMSGHYRSFWENNPYCKPAPPGCQGQLLHPQYVDGIKAAGRGVKRHFLAYWHEDFEKQTTVHVPVTEPRGDIHLSEREQANKIIPYRYWLVVAGGKKDMTTKIWPTQRYQEVVNALAARGIRCVQAGADFNYHFHPRLANCESAIGKTDSIRDLSLISHCEGVLCGITSFMHLAAVFNKPCVVLAGGREDWYWEAYTNNGQWPEGCAPVTMEHRFLHTVGLLDCSIGNMTKGCWRDRTVPLEATDLIHPRKRDKLCKLPLHDGPIATPTCMTLISVDQVLEAVMSYYERGEIPPVTPDDAIAGRITKAALHDALKIMPTLNWPKAYIPTPGEDPRLRVLDHPYIGGKFTVCICCYGDHLDLAQRCIDSILSNSPGHRIDLRIALNQPSKRVLDYFMGFDTRTFANIYLNRGDRKKYPAMRELFWDHTHPITTPYVLWFDDDSHVIDKDWLIQLGECIVKNHGLGCRLYGTKLVHNLKAYQQQGFHPEKWFQEAPWWHERWLHEAYGTRESPQGKEILFVTGGFWALALEAIRAADIPDRRLELSGGDITIGAQVTQAGFTIMDFCRHKTPVKWSDAPPRGSSHRPGTGPKEFPWSRVL